MQKIKKCLKFRIRNVMLKDIKEVYKLLVANRPYVGLNSRYTYFLLAKDFSNTCVVAEQNNKIIAFSSGYIPPDRPDTFFNWETVVDERLPGKRLAKTACFFIKLDITGAKYFEGTINPSNEASKRNFFELAQLLNTKCEEKVLFSEEDFENDGHEPEILYRIGPIYRTEVKNIGLVYSSQQR